MKVGGGFQGCLFPPHVFIMVVDAINDVIKAMVNVGHIQCIYLSDSNAQQSCFPNMRMTPCLQ